MKKTASAILLAAIIFSPATYAENHISEKVSEQVEASVNLPQNDQNFLIEVKTFTDEKFFLPVSEEKINHKFHLKTTKR